MVHMLAIKRLHSVVLLYAVAANGTGRLTAVVGEVFCREGLVKRAQCAYRGSWGNSRRSESSLIFDQKGEELRNIGLGDSVRVV